MRTTQMVGMGAMLTFAATLGSGLALGGGDNPPSEFGRAGNKGEGFTGEQAIKGRGENAGSTLRQDAQVTLGGARPVLEGEILKIEGDNFVIEDSTGSQVRVKVNNDTSMDCVSGADGPVTMSTGKGIDEQREIPPTAHMQEQASQGGPDTTKSQKRESTSDSSQTQPPAGGPRVGDQSGTQSSSTLGKDSGGDVARGSGFIFGEKGQCRFKSGDKVRAEVSDLGTVLYLKLLTAEDLQPKQAFSGQMIPQEEPRMPGEKAAADQHLQSTLKPGAAPAPEDLQGAQTGGREMAQEQEEQRVAKSESARRGSDQGSDVVNDPDNPMLMPSPITGESQQGKSVKGAIVAKDDKGVIVRGDPSGHEVMLELGPDQLKDLKVGDSIEAHIKDGLVASMKTLQPAQQGAGIGSSGTVQHSPIPDTGGSAPRVARPDTQGGVTRTPASVECPDCKLVEGKVLGRNNNTLMIRDRAKSEISLTLTQDTIVGRENPKYGGFLEGDRIEAYIRPDGQIHSITMTRPAAGRPGPDDLGD